MTGEIPPERPLKDRCEDLIEKWDEKDTDWFCEAQKHLGNEDENAWAYAHGKSEVYAKVVEELEALLDGEEP